MKTSNWPSTLLKWGAFLIFFTAIYSPKPKTDPKLIEGNSSSTMKTEPDITSDQATAKRAAITQSIRDEIAQDVDFSKEARNIMITTSSEGKVVLTGEVRNLSERNR